MDDDFITRYGLSAGHFSGDEDEVAEAVSGTDAGKSDPYIGCWQRQRHHKAATTITRYWRMTVPVVLGVMCSSIEIGGYAYRYLCNTAQPYRLLNYLQAVDGPIGRCFALIGESGERTFAIPARPYESVTGGSIPEAVIVGASALVWKPHIWCAQAGRRCLTRATIESDRNTRKA